MTTVLVIDDEEPIRLLCSVNLAAEGIEVLEAADGPSGLEQAREHRPDVVLLDVMMPGLDGWQVAERLLEDARHPDHLPDGAGRVPRPGARSRHRRRRLRHEAVQPARAGTARTRFSGADRARRARRPARREARRAP